MCVRFKIKHPAGLLANVLVLLAENWLSPAVPTATIIEE